MSFLLFLTTNLLSHCTAAIFLRKGDWPLADQINERAYIKYIYQCAHKRVTALVSAPENIREKYRLHHICTSHFMGWQ